jgi:glycosyltransferase involved in cell wall biosynthesis
MRILQVHVYAHVGGIESYTQSLFATLEERGHQNIVVYGGAQRPGIERSGRSVHHMPGLVEFGRSADELGEPVEEIVRGERPDMAFVHTPLNSRVAAVIVRSLPTVYFAHHYGGFCASGARFFRRTDSICELRGVPDARCLLNAYIRGCNTRRPARLRELYVRARRTGDWLREVDAIVCDSAYVAQRHVENGFPLERVHVVPSPAVLPEGRPRADAARQPVILFVGRVTPHKGLRYLIQALRLIPPPVRLVVVGDGYELPRMRALTAELALRDRVEFLGTLDRRQVADLYARAAVLAVPSVWPEPYGLVGPEAMAHGLPAVAYRVGGIPEWLIDGETGFLVEARDVAGLAARIQEILADSELARRLGARGREVVHERFAPAAHAAKLEEVFHGVVENRRSARGQIGD